MWGVGVGVGVGGRIRKSTYARVRSKSKSMGEVVGSVHVHTIVGGEGSNFCHFGVRTD